jgi:hypothetical protein
MTRPITHIVNVTTGEEIVREMNDEEYAIWLNDKEKIDAERFARLELQVEEDAKAEAKKTAKAQALAALGLSQEIVNLLAE